MMVDYKTQGGSVDFDEKMLSYLDKDPMKRQLVGFITEAYYSCVWDIAVDWETLEQLPEEAIILMVGKYHMLKSMHLHNFSAYQIKPSKTGGDGVYVIEFECVMIADGGMSVQSFIEIGDYLLVKVTTPFCVCQFELDQEIFTVYQNHNDDETGN